MKPRIKTISHLTAINSPVLSAFQESKPLKKNLVAASNNFPLNGTLWLENFITQHFDIDDDTSAEHIVELLAFIKKHHLLS